MRRLILSALAIVIGALPAATTGRAPRERPQLELRALDTAQSSLDRIEVGVEDLRESVMRTQPVTDLMLRLRHAVRVPRGRPWTPAEELENSYMEVQLFVVTGGRIASEVMAECDRFERDVLVCTVECEGGVFGLRRGTRAREHFLVVGLRPEDSPGGRPGFRLGACAARGEQSMLVMPKSGRLSAEVPLAEAR